MGSIRGLEGQSEAKAGEKERRKLRASRLGEEVTSSAFDFGVRGRNGHLGRGESRRRKERDWRGGVPASGCSSAEHRREADGGRPSAQNEEAVVEAWDSHGGNWRRMLTQDQWKIAEQS